MRTQRVLACLIGLTLLAPAAFAQRAKSSTAYPHASEPIGSVREVYDGALSPESAVRTFRNIDRLFPTRTVPKSLTPWPLPPAATTLTNVSFEDKGQAYDLIDYLQVNRIAALLVLKDGRVALEMYRYGNTPQTRWMSMSVAKSITSTLIGAAVKEGYIDSINDDVTNYAPALAGSVYEGATVRDVLMMASGVRWTEVYTDPTSDRRRLLEAQIAQQPGGAMELMERLPRAAEPGTLNNYNTGETQVAAEILRGAIDRPLADYLSERIWRRFGMEADANWWLESEGGIEIGGSGFSATLRDYGRFGLFMQRGGLAGGERILPDGWVDEATSPKVLKGGDKLAYGYLWWPGTSPGSRRDRTYMGIGIHGQTLYVNPAAKVVVVAWGARPEPMAEGVIDDFAFCDAVADALRNE
ncbi:6-aminohexanoate-dimer hydrolase [Posidoniimonas polymericola]|uniref:6-aminohexanoate-dimer hydrolase n=1 Tax=Posidoniimonas polymericola TaxID=2528002 RepID=A0A5C5YRS4_9BACT|nr:serine hydrolase [Posidoniimonas polymericola]TWT77674.1 6-aminohexanoate-dimer hydrolase [Posidoniimonas polymericola]